jgi:cyclic pyranopterin phosphate synthase
VEEGISRKSEGHDFIIDRQRERPAVARYISMAGG